MAASYRASPLVEVKDCTIWVRGTCALQRHSAYTTRLDINLRHRNPRLAVPAMEIAKKEGRCWAQRNAALPPRIHRHLHLRDLHYWRIPPQFHCAHCTYTLLRIHLQYLIFIQVFVAIHIAAITATSWILMLNGAVGYQLLDDGTAVSIGLLLISSIVIFIGTGYIALDTGLNWTGYWEQTRFVPNQAYALYTLYQLVPLVFIVIFFLLEAFLVLRVLGERKPMRKESSIFI